MLSHLLQHVLNIKSMSRLLVTVFVIIHVSLVLGSCYNYEACNEVSSPSFVIRIQNSFVMFSSALIGASAASPYLVNVYMYVMDRLDISF